MSPSSTGRPPAKRQLLASGSDAVRRRRQLQCLLEARNGRPMLLFDRVDVAAPCVYRAAMVIATGPRSTATFLMKCASCSCRELPSAIRTRDRRRSWGQERSPERHLPAPPRCPTPARPMESANFVESRGHRSIATAWIHALCVSTGGRGSEEKSSPCSVPIRPPTTRPCERTLARWSRHTLPPKEASVQ